MKLPQDSREGGIREINIILLRFVIDFTIAVDFMPVGELKIVIVFKTFFLENYIVSYSAVYWYLAKSK